MAGVAGLRGLGSVSARRCSAVLAAVAAGGGLFGGLVWAALQPRLSANGGVGFDGFFYARMAEAFARGAVSSVDAPFLERIGTPRLTTLAPAESVIDRFLIVNAVGAVLATAMLPALLLSLGLTRVPAARVGFSWKWSNSERRKTPDNR